MSGISFHPAFGNQGSAFGIYIKCTAYPASKTTIYDANAGPSGYERTALTPAGHVIAEYFNAGVTYNFDLGALPLNQWCWVSTATEVDGANNNNCRCWSSLYNAAGTLIGSNNTSVTNFATNRNTIFTAVLSIGLPGSGSYAAAPTDGTIKFSKLIHHNSFTGGNVAPIGGDHSGDLNDYMMRQTVGGAVILNDTGTSGQSMTAGDQGLIITTDGPYA